MKNAPDKELLRKIEDAPLTIAIERAGSKLKKQRSIYADQILFLLAILVMVVISYGFRPVFVCGISVLTCIIADMTGCFLSKKEYSFKDLSTIAYGLAVALMMPATVEYYIVAMGGLLAITVKHIFGGKDNYIFNPAAVAVAFLIICYPTQMLFYPAQGARPEIFGSNADLILSSGIESSFIKTGALPHLSALEVLMGSFAGAMGTTQILVLAVSGICLLFRRSLPLTSTACAVGSMALLAFVTDNTGHAAEAVVFQFINGFVLFGLIFLAGDPQTLPVTKGGRALFGTVLGVITVIFRTTASIEGVFVFALLITNALSLYLDRLAYNIGTTVKAAVRYLRTNLGSFERMSKDVKQGKTPALTDTQEIIIDPVNFNMPAIDNKVTKIKRRKRFSFKQLGQNSAKKAEQREIKTEEVKEDGDIGSGETAQREETEA